MTQAVAMTVSVVIPTFERPEDVRRALASLALQTRAPNEVLVVDDSASAAVRQTVQSFADRHGPFQVRYLRNPGARGLPRSRNEGLRATRGDLVVFFDDDVVLDPGYLATVATFMENHPDVAGVQGHWLAKDLNRKDRMLNAFDRAFGLFHYEARRARVLRNFNNTYPRRPAGPTECQWLSGCNQVYRRAAIEGLWFDENLARYGYKEDLDFSSRLHARGGRLVLLPEARLEHLIAPTARLPSRVDVLMRAAYSQYLYRKNQPRSMVGDLAFVQAKVGEFLRQVILLAVGASRHRKARWAALGFWFRAQRTCIRRRTDIRRGNLAFVTADADRQATNAPQSA